SKEADGVVMDMPRLGREKYNE
ncbi:hypothetical protein LCGC14_2441260, partial [marine sediment metagenome]